MTVFFKISLRVRFQPFKDSGHGRITVKLPHGLRHFVQQPCIAAGKRSGCVPGLPGPDQVAGPTQFKVLPGNFKPVIGAVQDLQLIRRI